MDAETARTLEMLVDGPRTPLAELPTSDAPRALGIYALWHGDELLYVGIARQDPEATTNPQAAGVRGRLATYLRARLTSDFTVAALLRFVVPRLDAADRAALADGTSGVREIQALTKAWIGDHVSLSACATTPAFAIATEERARRHGLGASGAPSFNPIR